MKNLIVLSLLFVTSIALADVKTQITQIEAREKVCLDSDSGTSNVGMKICVGTAGQEYDTLLNKIYRSIVTKFKAKPADQYENQFNKEALKRLVGSERSWLQFRRADAFLSGLTSYAGTQEGLDISESYNEITKARILHISDLLGQ